MPLSVFAVMVAVPAATAVTLPSLTVAIFSSLDDQETVSSVSVGVKEATSVLLCPSSTVNSVLERVTLEANGATV